MDILWQSNARHSPTGYGNQTNLFVPEIKRAGHNPAIFAFYGIEGAGQVDSDGITTLPRLIDGYGNDIIKGHMDFWKAHLLITLIDPFVLNPETYSRLPWCAWTPVDSSPILPANVNTLKGARWIWAMSRFGEAELHRAGFKNVTYVPHGVDTNLFKPGDRAEARQRLEKYWNRDLKDKFLIVMNSANKGAPSRKGFSEAIEAFTIFSKTHPDALLYIHTEINGIFIGENLPSTLAMFGVAGKVIFPPQYPLLMGMLPATYLNDVYNAGDVFFQPSHGEGFGVPVVEAQASGCPVIVTDFSAMPELVFAGSRVRGQKVMFIPGTYQMVANIEDLVHELHVHYGMREDGNVLMRESARAGALDYDYHRVFGQYMLPALRAIEEEINAPVQFHNPFHMHTWAKTGLYNEQGEMCVPCSDAECEAELRIRQDGSRVISETGFGTTVNGLKLDIEDDPDGGVAKIICREIERSYRLDEIGFQPGDVVIDIGAHVGIVSCYLAKTHPEIMVYAFEPVPANFERLKRNLIANEAKNVMAYNWAITSQGGEVILRGDLSSNSGGSSIHAEGEIVAVIPSVTLEWVFELHQVKECRLLKIDCEGAEYEILRSSEGLLSRVQALRGEFHENNVLGPARALIEMCKAHIPDVQVQVCRIADSREAKFEEARRARAEREASNAGA